MTTTVINPTSVLRDIFAVERQIRGLRDQIGEMSKNLRELKASYDEQCALRSQLIRDAEEGQGNLFGGTA